MTSRYFDLAFTPAVQAEQEKRGSRASYELVASISGGAETMDILTQRTIDFLEARDSFYLASVSETGWPYVQHRGGPAGFVRVLDEHTLGWAEFSGNRQYISVGNIATNDRVSLFFMDYPNRRRLKLLGHMRTYSAEDHPGLAARLTNDAYKAEVERFVLVTVEAFDWNCPQHIIPRYTLAEIEELVEPLHARIAELEAQLAASHLLSE